MRLFDYKDNETVSDNVLEDLNIIKFLKQTLDDESVNIMTRFLGHNIDMNEMVRRQEFFDELLHNVPLRRTFGQWIKYCNEINRFKEMYLKLEDELKSTYLLVFWPRYEFILNKIRDDLVQNNYYSEIIKEFHTYVDGLIHDKVFDQINDEVKVIDKFLSESQERIYKVSYESSMISKVTTCKNDSESIYSDLIELFNKSKIPIKQSTSFQYTKDKMYLRYIAYLVENNKKIQSVLTKTSNLIKLFLEENYHDLYFDLRIIDIVFLLHDNVSKNNNMCLPTFVNDGISIKGVYDLSILKDSSQIVKNDFELNNEMYMIIVSGVNSGGKTVFARAVGTAVLLALRGLFIPADSAKLPYFNGVYTFFNRSENSTTGRFEREMMEVQNVITTCDSNAYFIINELFSTTYYDKAKKMFREILDKCKSRGIKGIYVTNFLEIVGEMKKEKGVLLLSPEYKVNEQKRTYKIIKTNQTETYIDDILNKYGLKF